MARRCGNWLKTLADYVEETESPRHFWIWSGIFTICAALRRKVWLPFGLETIYPNLYVMFVAEPGWCRKAAPVNFAKKILTEIEVPVGIDSPTKRHLTKRLDELSKSQHFRYQSSEGDVMRQQAPLALVSRELSSFLAVDSVKMIEALTDLYDSHDVWDYGTSGAGEDLLRGLCVSCLFATTPGWMARNLPEEAIGGGFTSRFVIVSGTDRYKNLSHPPIPPQSVYRDLVSDLAAISQLCGEVIWSPKAFEYYDAWYNRIKDWAKEVGDDRLYASFSRVHAMAIKAAIAIHVASKDDLVIEEQDIRAAIKLITAVFETASTAFSSHGRSRTAIETDRLITQIEALGQVTFRRLLQMNYRNTDKVELREVLENIEAMGLIDWARDAQRGVSIITWKGGK